MKKLLALLLSVILLCSFGVGAIAVAPNELTPEELNALGRALLIQTMEDLRGDYTAVGSLYKKVPIFPDTAIFEFKTVIHSNGQYVFFPDNSNKNEYEIALTTNEVFHVYSNRNAYQRISPPDWVKYLPPLEPKEVTGDAQTTTILDKIAGDHEGIVVSYGGNSYTYSYYKYTDSYQLYRIVIATATYYSWLNGAIEKKADRSLFDIAEMREVTDQDIAQWEIEDKQREEAEKRKQAILNVLLWPLNALLNFLFTDVMYVPVWAILMLPFLLPFMIISWPINFFRRLF